MVLNFDAYYLEPIHEKHAWGLCDFVTSNADRLKRYFPLTLAANLTPELATIFTHKKVKEFHTKEEFLFIIRSNSEKNILGMVYLKELNWETKQGELAYCIGYTEEGKGIASKAVQNITDWTFKEHSLKTLQIIVHKTNVASIKVAQKCNFTWQKTLPKEHTPPNENPLDMELYERYNSTSK
ncbi:ribosomal-protein-alanine N-acetyltransferase [Maribacter vaceletii]|uniref:Ribosomal-protein-alanine N-acetyltransferase n=1 Tax=Maribacter vaceletii TaxID=1206816 RepID=A0A495ECY4_9FLAO|nr:GNAT family N-acetyltransferase [Maribacter vaceletii]RKR14666.1 ribosomal-protein-alanine N-acetyltransferase [Maribacter vaceletii]